MQNFQDIVFIWTQAHWEIFKSALVSFNLILKNWNGFIQINTYLKWLLPVTLFLIKIIKGATQSGFLILLIFSWFSVHTYVPGRQSQAEQKLHETYVYLTIDRKICIRIKFVQMEWYSKGS